MRAIALTLMLFAMGGTARADWTFTLDPAPAHAGQVVNVRVDDQSGCTPFSVPAVVREGSIVRISFLLDDGILPPPCLPERVAPRLHSLGVFLPGNYTVEVSLCGNVPPPLPACSVDTTLNLSVFGSSGRRVTVPMLSGAVAIGLMFAIMLIGWVGQRRI